MTAYNLGGWVCRHCKYSHNSSYKQKYCARCNKPIKPLPTR